MRYTFSYYLKDYICIQVTPLHFVTEYNTLLHIFYVLVSVTNKFINELADDYKKCINKCRAQVACTFQTNSAVRHMDMTAVRWPLRHLSILWNYNEDGTSLTSNDVPHYWSCMYFFNVLLPFRLIEYFIQNNI